MKAIPLDIPMTLEAWNIGRLAKTVSWVFKNSSVAWEDEITIVGTWPSRNDMMGGVYFWAKLWRPRCG